MIMKLIRVTQSVTFILAVFGILPALQSTEGARVVVDLNIANASDVALVTASATFAVNGSWLITGNSPGVGAAQWKAAIKHLGSGGHNQGVVVSEDNPTATIECKAVRSLADGTLNATFQYHETGGTPATQLNNSEIDAASAACDGAGVYILTRAYWPGSPWRTRVEAVLTNPNMIGCAMEFNPSDFGKRNEDDFVRALLQVNKTPIFLFPFLPNSAGKDPSEKIMTDFLQWLISKTIDVGDDRIVFVLANYDAPGLPYLGATRSIESAIIAIRKNAQHQRFRQESTTTRDTHL